MSYLNLPGRQHSGEQRRSSSCLLRLYPPHILYKEQPSSWLYLAHKLLTSVTNKEQLTNNFKRINISHTFFRNFFCLDLSFLLYLSSSVLFVLGISLHPGPAIRYLYLLWIFQKFSSRNFTKKLRWKNVYHKLCILNMFLTITLSLLTIPAVLSCLY